MDHIIKVLALKKAARKAALCFIGLQKFRAKNTVFRCIQKEIAVTIGKMIYDSFRDEEWVITARKLRNQSFNKRMERFIQFRTEHPYHNKTLAIRKKERKGKKIYKRHYYNI
ncbi:MAG: hypothetical protein Barrevirus25_3 [Barrevirus sp.]|uniref:Uncharacterized protein n=1 Tax=Barrevirus sp. TaxID=2487763 RepID=A0A3G4ZQS7_9VIRU|nr:MAG: hypothetical protein Barrevirus25_3 [Barrevirus sp.]